MAVNTYSTRESAAPMFTYDAIGNPTNILGVEMGWNGRQLTELTAPEDSYASHVTYAYNTDGQRVSKTVTLAEDQSTQTTEYFYNGEILAGQKTGDNTLVFMYDNNGDYFGFTVNGTPYYYVKNAQNDVIAVTDANGTILLRYHYNAWGEVWIESFFENDAEATEEAYLNPITYRSYYLDFETAFYYLNTRYYIPMFCRFLNADGVVNANQDILGNNLFAYCLNNPIIYADQSGESATIITTFLVGGMVIIATYAIFGCAVLLLNPSFQRALRQLTTSILDNRKIALSPVLLTVRVFTAIAQMKVRQISKELSITSSISKTVASTKAKIRKEKNKYDYWIAKYVDFGNGRGTYVPVTPLSYSRAISYVRAGGSVFADSRRHAYSLALAVGYGSRPDWDPPHGGIGYFSHYHATVGNSKRIGGHIFYI